MPSTRDLSDLPGVDSLRRLSQSLAMLDAILCPEWQYRYHSFNSRWAAGQGMASLRNGSGDDYFILFTGAGAIMKGFAHESVAWLQRPGAGRPLPGVFDGVSEEFAGFLVEPAFSIGESTFCLWRRSSDPSWRVGTGVGLDDGDRDGSAELMQLLDDDPATYRAWAEDYYEVAVTRSAVEQIDRHSPLAEGMVQALNPGLSLADVAEDAAEIGYPIGA